VPQEKAYVEIGLNPAATQSEIDDLARAGARAIHAVGPGRWIYEIPCEAVETIRSATAVAAIHHRTPEEKLVHSLRAAEQIGAEDVEAVATYFEGISSEEVEALALSHGLRLAGRGSDGRGPTDRTTDMAPGSVAARGSVAASRRA